MSYDQLINELRSVSEEKFADFQRKLVPTKKEILGICTPKMRLLAKKWGKDFEKLFSFPDEYFEVAFIKSAALASLPFDKYVVYVEKILGAFDNWAVCDCFKPKCVRMHKEEYLPYLKRFFATEKEFFQRHVLVTLLFYYIEPAYFAEIESFLRQADTSKYYVHMAAAWLVAEILIKDYEEGKRLLSLRFLPQKTQDKAIQKARESYRLTQEQKEELKTLKIKKGSTNGHFTNA